MEVKGKIKVVNDIQVISEKFSKREFVIETDETYPQLIKLELMQDKCSLIDAFKLGNTIVCNINLRGRKWTNKQGEDKYFNTIECWRITGAIDAQPNAPKQSTAPQPPAQPTTKQEDLPF